MTIRPPVTITLRQPSTDTIELVVTRDGTTVTYPLNLDQLKLIAGQAVRALCAWRDAS